MWILYYINISLRYVPLEVLCLICKTFPLVCLLRFVCKNPHVAEDVLWVLDNVHPDEIFEYYSSFAMEES